MIKLMYITNRVDVAKVVEEAGVERVFIDMEFIGKAERQGGMNTVQNRHTIEDVQKIRKVIKRAEILVRCNPIHDATDEFCSSKDEIDAIIKEGADIIMLPYFTTAEEVRTFIKLVDGRAKTMPLVETPEAVEIIDEILDIEGIDEIFIGLNDLSLGYGASFMFELLADGTVEKLCEKFKRKGIPYGFGGVASLGKGLLHSENVIEEHYRLGSTCAILSRSFCNVNEIQSLDEVKRIFSNGLEKIRNFEKKCEAGEFDFALNKEFVKQKVAEIEKAIEKKEK